MFVLVRQMHHNPKRNPRNLNTCRTSFKWAASSPCAAPDAFSQVPRYRAPTQTAFLFRDTTKSIKVHAVAIHLSLAHLSQPAYPVLHYLSSSHLWCLCANAEYTGDG